MILSFFLNLCFVCSYFLYLQFQTINPKKHAIMKPNSKYEISNVLDLTIVLGAVSLAFYSNDIQYLRLMLILFSSLYLSSNSKNKTIKIIGTIGLVIIIILASFYGKL